MVDAGEEPAGRRSEAGLLALEVAARLLEVAAWVTPTLFSSGLPAVSKPMAMPAAAIQSTNIAANTAQPCLVSFTSLPNV